MADRPPAARSLSPQVFQILLSLADRDRHGYAIIQDIRDRTGGAMRLTASTLYAALKRLLDERLIEERESHPDRRQDPRRRCYALTPAGRIAGRAEAARLEALAAMARSRGWLPRRPAKG
jgi:DNA-binding PadR family transcriptional regulator